MGRIATRDIVQFVAYRDFSNEGETDEETARSKLAKEVLAEVPDQFLSYMNPSIFHLLESFGKKVLGG